MLVRTLGKATSLAKCTFSPLMQSTRGAAGRWREMNKLPRRYASPSPLADSPEWSFVDGRGPGPLGQGQRLRYTRDKNFTEDIIKFTKMTREAKRLVPDDVNPKLTES